MMWKILLVDDEAVIVRGLRRLINWEALQAEVVGEATDGAMAAAMMERLRPDLVVSDIRVPEMSGLELMERFSHPGSPAGYAPKFIFISGYEEFAYARQALAGGAVDYLLKPVSAQALAGAVRRAQGLMEESNVAALLREPAGGLEDFFEQVTSSRAFAGSELQRHFAALVEGRPAPVFAGLCFGLMPEEEAGLEALPYERRLLQRFMVFTAIRSELEQEECACFLRKEDNRSHLMGVFGQAEEIEGVLRRAMAAVREKNGSRLRVGVGWPREELAQLSGTYEEAIKAFELFYFTESDLLVWNRDAPPAAATNDAFDEAAKAVFYSIVAKSDTVADDIDAVLDCIYALHYGNHNAAFNRALIFTGGLCQTLYASHLLTGSFTARQDGLQAQLEACPTFSQLRAGVQEYCRGWWPMSTATPAAKQRKRSCGCSSTSRTTTMRSCRCGCWRRSPVSAPTISAPISRRKRAGTTRPT